MSITNNCTVAPFPPPTDVSVNITDELTGPIKLTFKWSPLVPDCPSIRYITEFDCGSCPNTTTNTEVVCTDIVIDNAQCTFTVLTQICDSITGNINRVHLTLKGITRSWSVVIYIVRRKYNLVAIFLYPFLLIFSSRCSSYYQHIYHIQF